MCDEVCENITEGINFYARMSEAVDSCKLKVLLASVSFTDTFPSPSPSSNTWLPTDRFGGQSRVGGEPSRLPVPPDRDPGLRSAPLCLALVF